MGAEPVVGCCAAILIPARGPTPRALKAEVCRSPVQKAPEQTMSRSVPTRYGFPVGQTTRIVDRNGRETAPRLERDYPNAIARLRWEILIENGAIKLRIMIYKSINIKTSSPVALRSLLKLEMHAPRCKSTVVFQG